VAKFYREKKDHVITRKRNTSAYSILAGIWRLKGLKYVSASKDEWVIDLRDLEAAITPQTTIVSIMTVNNEIGVVQP